MKDYAEVELRILAYLQYGGVMDKKDYVRSQKQTRKHTCHWPGCNKQVPPAMWGCGPHWFKLPKKLRDEVWMAYQPGQEVSMRVSEDYLTVMSKVDKWIKEHS